MTFQYESGVKLQFLKVFLLPEKSLQDILVGEMLFGNAKESDNKSWWVFLRCAKYFLNHRDFPRSNL